MEARIFVQDNKDRDNAAVRCDEGETQDSTPPLIGRCLDCA